ncbi:MAG: hypothetical protein HY303_14555 [Candidatus Wallbacteria bacterium]|nr:hypothetical protein [Candidatus Wallbacteria bacterium]
MTHEGIGTKCPVCGDGIAEAPVFCTDCEAAHHRDCFAYNGKCAIYACSSLRYKQVRGPGPGVVWIEKSSKEAQSDSQAYVADFTSSRERWVRAAPLVLVFLAGLAYSGPEDYHGQTPYWPFAVELFIGLAVLSLIPLAGVSDYRIVDGKTQMIWVHETFFGRIHRASPETRFANCRHLKVQGRYRPASGDDSERYTWELFVVTQRGKLLSLSDPVHVTSGLLSRFTDEPPPALVETARRVGAIMDLEVTTDIRGRPTRRPSQAG